LKFSQGIQCRDQIGRGDRSVEEGVDQAVLLGSFDGVGHVLLGVFIAEQNDLALRGDCPDLTADLHALGKGAGRIAGRLHEQDRRPHDPAGLGDLGGFLDDLHAELGRGLERRLDRVGEQIVLQAQ